MGLPSDRPLFNPPDAQNTTFDSGSEISRGRHLHRESSAGQSPAARPPCFNAATLPAGLAGKVTERSSPTPAERGSAGRRNSSASPAEPVTHRDLLCYLAILQVGVAPHRSLRLFPELAPGRKGPISPVNPAQHLIGLVEPHTTQRGGPESNREDGIV